MKDTCPYPRPTAQNVCSLPGVLYYAWEREAIRIARMNDVPRERWTADPVLAHYRFTNIRRRDDRVSQWVLRRLTQPHARRGGLWFTLLVARLINWPPTLEALLAAGVLPCGPTDFNAAEFVRVVEECKAQQPKVYSPAYMVYPTGARRKKSESLGYTILPAAAALEPEVRAALARPSVETFVTTLAQAFGVSTFMAGQVAADLTYTPEQLGRATDLYTFAPRGPGSERGLNYLLHRRPFAQWAQADFNRELIDVRSAVVRELGIADLTLHDVQNVMCEYSKYCRVVLGHGALKNLYKPETEY